MTAQDGRYLWLGYKTDAFDKILFPSDLAPDEFDRAFNNWLSLYGAGFVIDGVVNDRRLPLLLVLVSYFDNFTTVVQEMVHMPWSTPRNRVEATVRFFDALRKDGKGLYVCKNDDDERFMRYIQRYGIMRNVGKLHDYGPTKKRLMMFETN